MITPAQIIEMTDKHEKGRALEYLSELLLASHHHNAVRISTPTPDRGIDRMGLLPDGTYVALQSKAYNSSTVGKHGWQAFTDEVRRVNREGEKRITQAVMFATARDGASRNALPSIDMLRAEVAVSEWYRDDLLSPDNAYLWNKEIVRPEPYSPRPHQAKAIRDARKLRKRGKVIMATGTGKTLIAAELIKHYGGLCLVLVPNMELVRQICLSFDRDIPDAKLLAVFSGEDVRDVRHGLNITAPATTDSELIKEFAKSDGLRVIVSTYQSSGKVSAGLRGLTVNFAVLDEAHRTVGGASKSDKGGFQVCMQDAGIKIKRRLFMTATPKMHGLKAKADAEAKSYVLYSMDDEPQYGQELHRLQPGKAIEDGLLAPFDVMAGLFRHARAKQYLKTDAKKYALDIDPKLTVEDVYRAAFLLLTAQEENLSRTLVFTSTVDRARLAAKALNKIAERLGIRGYAHVISHTSTPQMRREALGDLEHGKFGYDHVFVLNVDLFTEGVDIPALDGVVFIDSRKSIIAIAQAVGRALRLDPANPAKRAKIIIPVMITEKQDIDKVIDKGAFKAIRDYTIAIQDVGFNPEQTVMLAKETGAKTLGGAWSDDEGVEWVKWANSDLERNQKCIETILMGSPHPWTLSRLQELVTELGITLVDVPTPLSRQTKVVVLCKNGHTNNVLVSTLIRAHEVGSDGCGQCRAWTLDRLQESIGLQGVTVVDAPTPLTATSKVLLKCENGHTFTTTPNKTQRNVRCGTSGCGKCNKAPWTKDRAQWFAEKLGHTLISVSKPPVSSRSKVARVTLMCNKGHTFTIAASKLIQPGIENARGRGCRECSNPKWADGNRLQQIIKPLELTLISAPTPLMAKSIVTIKCKNGHTFTTTPDKLSMRSGTTRGSGCIKCPRPWKVGLAHTPETRAKLSMAKMQSHCKHGHPLSADNLYVSPSGMRGCKTCRRQNQKNSAMNRKNIEHELKKLEYNSRLGTMILGVDVLGGPDEKADNETED